MHEAPSPRTAGLQICKGETLDYTNGQLSTEVLGTLNQESSLEPGEHFFLFPDPLVAASGPDTPPEGVEGCLVVEGEGCCDARAERLRAGDLMIVGGADGPAALTAETRLRLQHTQHQSVSAPLDPDQLGARLACKDPPSMAHAARVQRLALAMGRALTLTPTELERLAAGAYFHDIGKLAIPGAVLAKPGALTLGEWRLIVKHTRYGRTLLARTPLAAAAAVAEQHHERLDGSGYPYGLSGEEIALPSYLVGLADSFDAMTHRRPYRPARDAEQALSELNRYANVLYPGELVAALNAVVKRDLA